MGFSANTLDVMVPDSSVFKVTLKSEPKRSQRDLFDAYKTNVNSSGSRLLSTRNRSEKTTKKRANLVDNR